MEERKNNLSFQVRLSKEDLLLEFLEDEVWSKLPTSLLGKGVSQKEQDEMLDYGEQGI